MKKTIILLFFIICIILTSSIPTFAVENTISELAEVTEITYFDDGSYIVSTIVTESMPFRTSSFTKCGHRVVSYYNESDELMWQYTLYGEFNVVSGVSAICTSSTYTQTIYGNRWSFSNGQATASGNSAYGIGTFTKKVLFVTTQTVDIDISINCDVYGNLSSN